MIEKLDPAWLKFLKVRDAGKKSHPLTMHLPWYTLEDEQLDYLRCGPYRVTYEQFLAREMAAERNGYSYIPKGKSYREHWVEIHIPEKDRTRERIVAEVALDQQQNPHLWPGPERVQERWQYIPGVGYRLKIPGEPWDD